MQRNCPGADGGKRSERGGVRLAHASPEALPVICVSRSGDCHQRHKGQGYSCGSGDQQRVVPPGVLVELFDRLL